MDLEAIADQARRIMGKRVSHPGRAPGYIFEHGQRVAQIALRLRQLIFPGNDRDDQVLLVGGWFHDVAKGIEPHWEYGKTVTEQALKAYCAPQELNKIVEIVSGHTLRKAKAFPNYVKLVQDADILDHYGTQHIWLNFAERGRQEGGLAETGRFFRQDYAAEVQTGRGLLNFQESVRIFEEKDRFVRSFVERFLREAAGEVALK